MSYVRSLALQIEMTIQPCLNNANIGRFPSFFSFCMHSCCNTSKTRRFEGCNSVVSPPKDLPELAPEHARPCTSCHHPAVRERPVCSPCSCPDPRAPGASVRLCFFTLRRLQKQKASRMFNQRRHSSRTKSGEKKTLQFQVPNPNSLRRPE